MHSMARKIDISAYQTFSQIGDRLDDIVSAVRDKDISLERSLDLFDEAIALGSKAVDMVDATDFTPEEEAQLAAKEDAEQPGEGAEEAASEQAVPEEPQDSQEEGSE